MIIHTIPAEVGVRRIHSGRPPMIALLFLLAWCACALCLSFSCIAEAAKRQRVHREATAKAHPGCNEPATKAHPTCVTVRDNRGQSVTVRDNDDRAEELGRAVRP